MPNIPTTRGAAPILAETGGRLQAPPRIPSTVVQGIADVGSALYNIGMREQDLINRADEAAAEAKLENFISDYRMKIAQSPIQDKTDFDRLDKEFMPEWDANVKEAMNGMSRDSQKRFGIYQTEKFPVARHRVQADIFAKRVPYYQDEFRVQHLAAVKRGDITTAEKLVDDHRQWFDAGEVERIALENSLYINAMKQPTPEEAGKYVMDNSEGLSRESQIYIRNTVVSEKRIEQAASIVQSEKLETDITNDIVKFQDKLRNGTVDMTTPTEILNRITQGGDEGLLNGTQIRVLNNYLNSVAANIDKTATEEQKLDILDKIYDNIDNKKRDEAKELLRENSWMFSTAKNGEILKDIRDIGEASEDIVLRDALDKERDFTTKVRSISEISTPEEAAAIELASLERRQQIRQYFKENPDATLEQRLGAIQNILTPAKEEAAKDLTEKWYQKLWRYEKTYLLKGPYGFTRMALRERNTAPADKETIRVKSPDGTIGRIPAGQWEEAEKAGYVKAE